jgi:hypothetical protein
MCRNIKQLHQTGELASDEEIRLAALQYVRKVSGYRIPSRRNQPAFDEAIQQVAQATKALLEQLG